MRRIYSNTRLSMISPTPSKQKVSRRLDFFLAVHNRPKALHHILQSGLAMNIPGIYFIVFDDASDSYEYIEGLGKANVEMVCKSFEDAPIIYVRNSTNIGFAKSLERYYNEVCDAKYTALLNPKDEFIDAAPLIEAIEKLDNDSKISLIIYPLQQKDRVENDKPLKFKYDRMSGREFIASHINDPMLQHCSSYGIMRVSSARKAGIPRNMDLRAFGLEDGSGIDHDLIFNVALTGDVDFVSEPIQRRTIVGGFTEQYPLTFAYAQYQYARRLMIELGKLGLVSRENVRKYLSFWLLLITRGLVVSYIPVHGSEQEKGVKRISPHLSLPILLYIPLEFLRFRILPDKEVFDTYKVGGKLLLKDWLRKIMGKPHVC